MIIKKYNQYIKNKKTNENIEDFDGEMDHDYPMADESGEEESEIEDNLGMPGEDDDHSEEGQSEEGGYYGDNMLGELADKLGTKVVNNTVLYNGKSINFYSETNKFHVDNHRFKTVDEVIEYLSSKPEEEDSYEPEMEEEMVMQESKKRFIKKRTFESFKKK
jgi:hypothetical protein